MSDTGEMGKFKILVDIQAADVLYDLCYVALKVNGVQNLKAVSKVLNSMSFIEPSMLELKSDKGVDKEVDKEVDTNKDKESNIN